ncbi:hypothetical protein B0H13DRAFT_1921759 [Mycena leptocephala]|nr:hypothetical protein B0H13DRAFT_1921759 [Mycena leptocephala]
MSEERRVGGGGFSRRTLNDERRPGMGNGRKSRSRQGQRVIENKSRRRALEASVAYIPPDSRGEPQRATQFCGLTTYIRIQQFWFYFPSWLQLHTWLTTAHGLHLRVQSRLVKLGYQFFGDEAICGATERSECAPSSASPTVQLRQYLATYVYCVYQSTNAQQREGPIIQYVGSANSSTARLNSKVVNVKY